MSSVKELTFTHAAKQHLVLKFVDFPREHELNKTKNKFFLHGKIYLN